MAEMRPQGGGIRDPYAWREALSPVVTPTGSARNSARGGASGSSTPRSPTPPTPPGGRSPVRAPDDDRSGSRSGSGLSARSGFSARSARSQGGVYAGYPGGAFDGLSARTSASQFATPEPSARTSEFASAYEPSVCASARNAEAFDDGTGRRRHKAMAAAFDAFAPPVEEAYGASFPASPAAASSYAGEAEASLDPKVLYSAARHGKYKEVEASLEAGFDPFYQDQFGNTLFHVACQNGNKRVAKMAIKYGGDMDAQNSRGNTGLHFLFSYGYAEIAEYFIEKGAQEQIPNENGKLPREGIR
mmetsp:Transcript_25532/g.67495  ORF Transcript_25532/g.67495 Transcript_25532/m.67495 type:complete len:302 (-) Transcript_25532:33-938(-)